MKAFRQVTDKPEQAEVITLSWAANTAADHMSQLATYLECCSKSDNAHERLKYYESALKVLGHLVVCNQMIGALSDPDILIQSIFGLIPVEIVDWEPNMEGNDD